MKRNTNALGRKSLQNVTLYNVVRAARPHGTSKQFSEGCISFQGGSPHPLTKCTTTGGEKYCCITPARDFRYRLHRAFCFSVFLLILVRRVHRPSGRMAGLYPPACLVTISLVCARVPLLGGIALFGAVGVPRVSPCRCFLHGFSLADVFSTGFPLQMFSLSAPRGEPVCVPFYPLDALSLTFHGTVSGIECGTHGIWVEARTPPSTSTIQVSLRCSWVITTAVSPLRGPAES